MQKSIFFKRVFLFLSLLSTNVFSSDHLGHLRLWPETKEEHQVIAGMIASEGIEGVTDFWNDTIVKKLVESGLDYDRINLVFDQIIQGFLASSIRVENSSEAIDSLLSCYAEDDFSENDSDIPPLVPFSGVAVGGAYAGAGVASHRIPGSNRLSRMYGRLKKQIEKSVESLNRCSIRSLGFRAEKFEQGDCSLCCQNAFLYRNVCRLCTATDIHFCEQCCIKNVLKNFISVSCSYGHRDGVDYATLNWNVKSPECPYCRSCYYNDGLKIALSSEQSKAVVVLEIKGALDSLAEEGDLAGFLTALIASNEIFKDIKIFHHYWPDRLLSTDIIALQIYQADQALAQGVAALVAGSLKAFEGN